MTMSLPPLMKIEDLFADPTFAAARISPDGTRLAYLAPAHGRLNVWVRGIDEEHDQATLVTHSSHRGIGEFHWTDNPRYLCFLQDGNGDECWHIYRVDLENPDAAPLDLTPNEPGVRAFGIEQYDIYPGKILTTMNKRDLVYMDVFLIDLETGETEALYENPGLTGGFIPKKTGGALYTKLQADGTFELYDVDDETGDHRLFFSVAGPEYPLGIYPNEVTPDGSAVLMGLYLDDDALKLVRVDIKTGEKTFVGQKPGPNIDVSSLVAMGHLPPAM